MSSKTKNVVNLKKFISTDLNNFNKTALIELAPYFDLNFTVADTKSHYLWFHNLFQLAQVSLGLAHCIHHNQTARLAVSRAFDSPPNFFLRPYTELIGCYCGYKTTDTIKLDNNNITGTKHWISLVDQADFGVFRINNSNNQLQYVLVDFKQITYSIDTNNYIPLGMEIARPGSFTVDNQSVPEHYVLMSQEDPKSFALSNFHDYCFITNYLGCATALFNDIKNSHDSKNYHNSEFDRLKLQLSTLHLLWKKNLESVTTIESSDEFWHQRNTQYAQGKALIIDLVRYILITGSSYHLDLSSAYSQRFRDALMLSTHMKSLSDNIQNLHFYKISS